jgi:hypothetical protein
MTKVFKWGAVVLMLLINNEVLSWAILLVLLLCAVCAFTKEAIDNV